MNENEILAEIEAMKRDPNIRTVHLGTSRVRVCLHEAGHAVAAALCGWLIVDVTVYDPDDPNPHPLAGVTNLNRRLDRQEGMTFVDFEQAALIQLAGGAAEYIFQFCEECERTAAPDWEKVAALIPHFCPHAAGNGQVLIEILNHYWHKAVHFLRFHHKEIQAVGRLLFEKTTLTGAEVLACVGAATNGLDERATSE